MGRKMICVLGVGEVGSSIAQVFSAKFEVLKKDLKIDEVKSEKIDVLHVCLPYNKGFIKLVQNQAKANRPKLIIIHSTVKPTTSKKIAKLTKIPTAHSPVMGTHPNLGKYIKSFKKIIGPTSKKSATLADAHLKAVGIKTVIFKNAEESELGKLLDTTYYGWNIMFNKLVHNLCKENKLDFENVYEAFNKIYNEGYKKDKPNVIRPILKYQKGKIGGHCIIPNLEILQSIKKTDFGTFVISQNQKLKD